MTEDYKYTIRIDAHERNDEGEISNVASWLKEIECPFKIKSLNQLVFNITSTDGKTFYE